MRELRANNRHGGREQRGVLGVRVQQEEEGSDWGGRSAGAVSGRGGGAEREGLEADIMEEGRAFLLGRYETGYQLRISAF